MNPLGLNTRLNALYRSTVDRLAKSDRKNLWFSTIEEAQNETTRMLDVETISKLSAEEETILRLHLLNYFSELSKQGHISREQYSSPLLERFLELLNKKLEMKLPSEVSVGDFGAAKCEFISSIRRRYPGIHVTATSLEDYLVGDKVDRYIIAPFEALPAELKNNFDIIVSHVAWQYSLLPHIALRNMAETMKEGGVGILYYGKPTVFDPVCSGFDDNEFYQLLLSLYNEKVPLTQNFSSAYALQTQARLLIKQELEALEKRGFRAIVSVESFAGTFKVETVSPSEIEPVTDHLYIEEVEITRI